MLAQVKGIKDPTPKKTEEAMNEDRESNFVVCTYPSYKGDKVLRIILMHYSSGRTPGLFF